MQFKMRALMLFGTLAAAGCTTFGDVEISLLTQEVWTDPVTGDRWTFAEPGTVPWETAVAACHDLDRAGEYWRAPTLEEAVAVGRNGASPAPGIAWTKEVADYDPNHETGETVILSVWAVRLQDGVEEARRPDRKSLAVCVNKSSESGSEICLTGEDEDGDTLTDCEDLDCWGSEECGADCNGYGGTFSGRACACVSNEGCDDMEGFSGQPLECVDPEIGRLVCT